MGRWDRGVDLKERPPRIYDDRCSKCGSFMTSDSAYGCTPEECSSMAPSAQYQTAQNREEMTVRIEQEYRNKAKAENLVMFRCSFDRKYAVEGHKGGRFESHGVMSAEKYERIYQILNEWEKEATGQR